MKQLADRRTVLLTVGTAAVAVVTTGAAASRPTTIKVTVEFENGEVIPKGQLLLYLDTPGGQGDRQSSAATAKVDSDGGSSSVALSVPIPAAASTSSPQQVVATLQREDGWLLARGSAQIDPGTPLVITLYTVMY